MRTWQCPFCGAYNAVSDRSSTELRINGSFPDEDGRLLPIYSTLTVDTCQSPTCFKSKFHLKIATQPRSDRRVSKTIFSRTLIPDSSAKIWPEYIPEAILGDYEEACKIRQLSPKAAAALCRRALQGIIRDFWEIEGKRNLWEEIQAIKEKVDTVTWDAIDAVRKIGNIGAHMERDVNLIIDVDPEEAELLIGLIETVLSEWYVARHDRQRRMRQLAQVAEAKGESKGSDGSSGSPGVPK